MCVCVCVYVLSRVQLFIIPWTTARQAPLSMGLPRQEDIGILYPEYWSGLLFPPPGNLPNAETEPESPTLQADSLQSEPPGKP